MKYKLTKKTINDAVVHPIHKKVSLIPFEKKVELMRLTFMFKN